MVREGRLCAVGSKTVDRNKSFGTLGIWARLSYEAKEILLRITFHIFFNQLDKSWVANLE